MKALGWQFEFDPIVLKDLIINIDVSQEELADAVGEILGRSVSRPTMNLCVNRGYLPRKMKGFKEAVEQAIRSNPAAMFWLLASNMSVDQIWKPLGMDLRRKYPVGQVRRIVAGMHGKDPAEDLVTAAMTWEVEMLHPDAMKHFKLFINPFQNSVNSERDIFMSQEHIYAEAAMLDAAHHAGFIALIGEVGCGKSTIRKKVVEALQREGNVTVIEPRTRRINVVNGAHSRINAVSLCDAIIMDISDEKPQIRTEHKVRQVESLLISRANQGYRHVLIIEEAHNLNPVSLKYLKQFYEFEDGYKRLLGIILIGQPELKEMLDERRHVDMREVIRRIQIAEISGLGSSLRDYFVFKFKRINVKLESIVTDEAIEELSKRLTIEGVGKQKISQAYPGLVENYLIRAMNVAFELGEPRVTGEIFQSI